MHNWTCISWLWCEQLGFRGPNREKPRAAVCPRPEGWLVGRTVRPNVGTPCSRLEE